MHLPPLLDEVRRRHDPGSQTARRLFHGRGGCYPGLDAVTVDWFPPVAVVTLHAPAPAPRLDALEEGLGAILGERLECLLVQRRDLPGAPWRVLRGAIPEPAYAVEAGLRYRLRLGEGQNLGYFPDMIDGRALVRRLATGRRVLNLFAYTCAFSVAALAGGAEQVTNLDMNRGVLELGRQNHRDNSVELRRASFLAHDLFKSFGKLRRLGPFGLVVVDPPSHQGASFSARRDWPRLLRHLPSLLAPGAEVVACLNSPHLGPEFLVEQFAAHAPGCSLREILPPPEDFPDRSPERGLNVLRFRWEG
ncbi:MAG TPA: class I SAM-dependent methyltransferase [Deferrisomatales bacterium]|nr:class I SAM-dependent methyltransferase [Deferrisomatales bacterium]